MGLILCKACDRPISTKAEVCVHCSHPHEKERKENANFRQMVWMLVLLIVFAILLKTGLFQIIIEKIVDNFTPKLPK